MFQELPKKLVSDKLNNIHIALLTNAEELKPTLRDLAMEYFVKPGYVSEATIKDLHDTLDDNTDRRVNGAFTNNYLACVG